MRVVVDTNILFSYFWKNSLTKKLLESQNFELVSPLISIKEIKRYEDEIIVKADISKREFLICVNRLRKIVEFVNESIYKEYLKESKRISPDKSDAEFLALCLKERTFLWSNDSALKNQDKVNVLSTKEIIELLFD